MGKGLKVGLKDGYVIVSRLVCFFSFSRFFVVFCRFVVFFCLLVFYGFMWLVFFSAGNKFRKGFWC